jgi:hypothetical protein
MRKLNTLLGMTLTVFAVGAASVQAHAAEPRKAKASLCKAQPGAPCKPSKQVSQRGVAVPATVTKAMLNHSVCGRLQSQLERDTCLNRVEATT